MPHLDDTLPWSLVERYLAGTCSSEEHARVEQHFASHPAQRAEIEELHTVWATVAALRPEGYDARQAWRAVDARLGEPVDSEAPGHIRQSGSHLDLWTQRIGGRTTWRAATITAVVLVAISLGLARGVLRRAAGLTAPGREFTTAAGQRLSVTLVDGTQLMLAQVSRLRVAADYGRSGRAREVQLEGEAYFAVARDAARPFAVRTRGAVAKDVGTAFDVQAYSDDDRVRIAVAEGEVAVSAASQPSVANVRAGDVAIVAKKGVTVKHGADVAAMTGWMQGRLVFEDTPLHDALQTIGRMYGVEIRIADSALVGHDVTAAFDNQSVDQVLKEVTGIVGADYEWVGRTAVIRRAASSALRQAREVRTPLRTAQAWDERK